MTTPYSLDLLWQQGVDEKYFTAARNALVKATTALGLTDKLSVVTIGTHADIEKIINAARLASASMARPPQAHVDVVNLWIESRRWRSSDKKGCAIMLVNDDLGCFDEEFVFGAADLGVGGTVSTYRFVRDDRILDPIGLFETLVMHELGHTLGAANPERGRDIELWGGPHCTNLCVMQQRDDLPEFEADVLLVARTAQPYCAQCVRDVQKFFCGYFAA